MASHHTGTLSVLLRAGLGILSGTVQRVKGRGFEHDLMVCLLVPRHEQVPPGVRTSSPGRQQMRARFDGRFRT